MVQSLPTGQNNHQLHEEEKKKVHDLLTRGTCEDFDRILRKWKRILTPPSDYPRLIMGRDNCRCDLNGGEERELGK